MRDSYRPSILHWILAALLILATAGPTSAYDPPPPGVDPCYMPDEEPPNCLPWDWEHHESWSTESECYIPSETPPCLPQNWEHDETWPTQTELSSRSQADTSTATPSTSQTATPSSTPTSTTSTAPSPKSPATPTVAARSSTMDPATPSSAPENTCAEDEPCWDCATMGNQICGQLMPDTATHQPVSWATIIGLLLIASGLFLLATGWLRPRD